MLPRLHPPAAAETHLPRNAAPAVPLLGRIERMALLLAVLVIAGLHAVNGLCAGPLWRDEVGDAVYAAMPSWTHVWAMLKYDNFPPGLLVALRAWRGLGLENLGGPDFGYRVYGGLVGLALVGACWFNARVFGGSRHAPWFSLGLFAAGGLAVRVGDSVRPYGPGWLCMLLTFGLVWRVVCAPRAGRIALAALAAMLAVQCLYQNAFMLLGIGAAGMLAAARAGRWRTVAAVAGIGALAAVSLLPYALGPVRAAGEWSMVSRLGLGWKWMFTMLWQAAGSLNNAVPWLWLAAVAATGWAAWRFPANDPAREPDVRWYAVGSVAVAFPLFIGFLKALGMSTTPWYYLLPLALTASALDALGAIPAHDRRWRVGRLAFLGVTLAVALPTAWTVVQVRVTNADLIAARVRALAQPGDCVLVCPWAYGVSFHYHYRGTVPWTTLPPLEDNSIHRYDLMKARMTSPEGIAPVLARLGDALRAGRRVWIVGWLDVPPVGATEPVLPPAPLDPVVGWDETAYTQSWARQVGGYLRTHGQTVSDAAQPLDGRVSSLENLRLYCIQGWQP